MDDPGAVWGAAPGKWHGRIAGDGDSPVSVSEGAASPAEPRRPSWPRLSWSQSDSLLQSVRDSTCEYDFLQQTPGYGGGVAEVLPFRRETERALGRHGPSENLMRVAEVSYS